MNLIIIYVYCISQVDVYDLDFKLIGVMVYATK